MRKIIFILLIVIGIDSCQSQRQTNWRYSLDRNSTEPFGCFLAYSMLPQLFIAAEIKGNNHPFDSIYEANQKKHFDKQNQLYVFVIKNFHPTQDETAILYEYLKKGGNVFLATTSTNAVFDSLFKIKISFYDKDLDDTVMHYRIPFREYGDYKLNYPLSISYLNDSTPNIIGRARAGKAYLPIITSQTIGEGTFILCTAPEICTNLFLLKENNISFYEFLFSHFQPTIYDIHWYSSITHNGNFKKPNSNLWTLLKQKQYLFAFLILILLMILYLLFESKRRQRAILVLPELKNESMTFTETVGKLYFHQKDHKKLSEKMLLHYFEHLRSTYSIQTSHIQQDFLLKLSKKLNKPKDEVQSFITYLTDLQAKKEINENDIKYLYNQLKKYN